MKKILIIAIIILLFGAGIFYIVSILSNSKEGITKDDPYIVGKIYSISEERILVAEGIQTENYTEDISEFSGRAICIKGDV